MANIAMTKDMRALNRVNPEYLRRNLLHCKAIGAMAGAEKALERVMRMKRRPKWLVESLLGIIDRVGPLGGALACYRSAAPQCLESDAFSEPPQ